MSFNAWTPKGNVITGNDKGNPSVIYTTTQSVTAVGNPCFQMFYGEFDIGKLFIAESADGLTGWTQYSGNPITVPPGTGTGAFFPVVWNIAGTYYMFACGSISAANISRWTSTDGITWSAPTENTIVLGGVGAWDHNTVAQVALCAVVGGTWHGYYFGNKAGGLGGLGHVTSTDQGQTWAKDAGNPLITNANGQPGPGTAAGFTNVGNNYYCYASSYFNVAGTHTLGLSAIFRWSAPSPSGPWTQLMLNGNQVPVYYPAFAADFVSATAATNQGDLSILYVPSLGNTYLYYDVGAGNTGLEGFINQAVAIGFTPAQLVASPFEGVLDAPISGAPSLNLVTLASDNFQRPDGTLGANWTPLATTGTFAAAQIASHLVEKNTQNSADMYWSALSWAPDQWAQSTIAAVVDGSSSAGVDLHMNIAGTATAYRFKWVGALGVSGTLSIVKLVATVQTTLASNTGFVFNIGDTIMGSAVLVSAGTFRLLFYWNGLCIAAIDDTVILTGAAGLQITSNTGVPNAQISAWSGGSFQAAALPVSTGSGSGIIGQGLIGDTGALGVRRFS